MTLQEFFELTKDLPLDTMLLQWQKDDRYGFSLGQVSPKIMDAIRWDFQAESPKWLRSPSSDHPSNQTVVAIW